MLEYYSWILKLAIFILSGLTVTGAFCSVGWLLSEKELKKTRALNNILHSKVRIQSLEIESLKARNGFLLSRVVEETENLAEIRSEKASEELEKMDLEDRLHKALAAVRSDVDEKTDCQPTDETAEA